MSNSRRNRGNNAERHYARLFREAGFPFCRTSRQTSKLTDDCGIDLTGLPFNVQIKAGKQNSMNPHKVLATIRERLPENFPSSDPIHNRPNILIHRKLCKSGKRRTEYDDIVYITKSDIEKHFNEKVNPWRFLISEVGRHNHGKMDYSHLLIKHREYYKDRNNDLEYDVIFRDKEVRDIPLNSEFCELYIMTYKSFEQIIKKKIWH